MKEWIVIYKGNKIVLRYIPEHKLHQLILNETLIDYIEAKKTARLCGKIDIEGTNEIIIAKTDIGRQREAEIIIENETILIVNSDKNTDKQSIGNNMLIYITIFLFLLSVALVFK